MFFLYHPKNCICFMPYLSTPNEYQLGLALSKPMLWLLNIESEVWLIEPSLYVNSQIVLIFCYTNLDLLNIGFANVLVLIYDEDFIYSQKTTDFSFLLHKTKHRKYQKWNTRMAQVSKPVTIAGCVSISSCFVIQCI